VTSLEDERPILSRLESSPYPAMLNMTEDTTLGPVLRRPGRQLETRGHGRVAEEMRTI
jgi:hypothetical protein